MKAPLPEDEGARLAALRQFKVLDSEPEEAFDAATRLAALVCQAPIALITLVDADRQWFKSHVGFDARETSRDVSFCAHAILQPGPLVLADPREFQLGLLRHQSAFVFCAGDGAVTMSITFSSTQMQRPRRAATRIEVPKTK